MRSMVDLILDACIELIHQLDLPTVWNTDASEWAGGFML